MSAELRRLVMGQHVNWWGGYEREGRKNPTLTGTVVDLLAGGQGGTIETRRGKVLVMAHECTARRKPPRFKKKEGDPRA